MQIVQCTRIPYIETGALEYEAEASEFVRARNSPKKNSIISEQQIVWNHATIKIALA